jgi:hypothetical protein
MKKNPPLLTKISSALYWISMTAMVIGALVYISGLEKILAYAFALGSVVSMMASSILIYIRSLVTVGSEIVEKDDNETSTDSEESPEKAH